jgi:tRNA threonylcarbamoyladenosine biosynthesis protein TsaB
VGPKQTLLALDTATRRASVAVCRGETLLAEGSREVTTHSEQLLPLIDEVLQRAGLRPAQLDGVVCGRGPGSFTGLRIGMATAKGLCFASGKPLVALSSLLPLALAAGARVDDGRLVVAILDARRQEVYCGLYRGGSLLGEEVVLRPESLAEWLPDDEDLVLAGDGAVLYGELLLSTMEGRVSLAPEGCHQIDARFLAWAAASRFAAGEHDDLRGIVPLYIRSSDARLPKTPQARPPGTGGARESGSEEERLPLEVERLRRSGLKLDREGRWWHEGSPVEHPRLIRALHRWLDRLGDGRFVLRFDEGSYAYVEVEDAPYLVRRVALDRSEQGLRVYLTLSDECEEELAYGTLRLGPDGAVLYCRVKGGRFEARFGRSSTHGLGELMEETASGFALRAAGALWPIGSR